jgi:hypothetical protein
LSEITLPCRVIGDRKANKMSDLNAIVFNKLDTPILLLYLALSLPIIAYIYAIHAHLQLKYEGMRDLIDVFRSPQLEEHENVRVAMYAAARIKADGSTKKTGEVR